LRCSRWKEALVRVSAAEPSIREPERFIGAGAVRDYLITVVSTAVETPGVSPFSTGWRAHLRLSTSEWAVLRWLVPLALLHGLLYLVLVPPWQHYDEPTHFEYAALIARDGRIPVLGVNDPELRREIADSMYRYRFWDAGVTPDLIRPEGPGIGADQRVHPPLYYTLAALPLRLTRYLSVEQQLYAARLLSVCIYALTIVVAWRIVLVVVPDEPVVQQALPLILLLTPTFVDVMTAVNSDVLLNLATAAMLLGCALLLRDGLRPAGLALALLGLAAALLTKRTAVAATVVCSLALFWGGVRRPLSWRWVAPIGVAVGLILLGLATRPAVVDGHPGLVPRPWLAALDQTYLRLGLDAWFASITDLSRAREAYLPVLYNSFSQLWLRFGWSHIGFPAFVVWLAAGFAVLISTGLFLRIRSTHALLPLWQRRFIWLLVVTVLIAWLAVLLRVHPLPPPGETFFVPGGRYLLWALFAHIWLLLLGWQGLLPEQWRARGPLLLAGLFLLLDVLALTVVIVGFYYHS
jgi:hypothetical protein